jgi:hypothetical protein
MVAVESRQSRVENSSRSSSSPNSSRRSRTLGGRPGAISVEPLAPPLLAQVIHYAFASTATVDAMLTFSDPCRFERRLREAPR